MNVGELVDLARSVAPADELCGCGEPFSRCPLWTQVGEVAFGGWTAGRARPAGRLQRAAARQRHLPGLLGSRRTAVRRADRPARGVRPHLPGRRRGDGRPRRRRRLQGAGPRARRSPARRASTCGCSTSCGTRAPSPGRGAGTVERPHATVRRPRRCGASRRTGRRRSGAPCSSRWRPSPDWAAPGRRGCATRTSSPTPSAPWSHATGAARRPALRRRPPARRGRAGSCSVPATGCRATRAGSARAPSSSAATTAGPPRCRRADRAVVTALTLPLLRAYGYSATTRATAASTTQRSTRSKEHT